jgi:hypothetical protein
MQGDQSPRTFMWHRGKSLDEALAEAGLTLADKPLRPIRFIPVRPDRTREPDCPLYLRDRHLLD